MRTLLSEQYAPITSTVGFLEAPIDDVADAMETWLQRIRETVTRTPLTGPDAKFPEVLERLLPLEFGSSTRQLFVPIGTRWTAHFDCFMLGTDPQGVISVVGGQLGCRGLIIESYPDTYSVRLGTGRLGGVKFWLYGPEPGNTQLASVRTVEAIRDGERWVFDAFGEEQPYEELDRYTARRKRDRFTSDMLERYCQALGIDAFNPNAYGPDAVLFESAWADMKPPKTATLEEIQTLRHIVPGMADTLPG